MRILHINILFDICISKFQDLLCLLLETRRDRVETKHGNFISHEASSICWEGPAMISFLAIKIISVLISSSSSYLHSSYKADSFSFFDHQLVIYCHNFHSHHQRIIFTWAGWEHSPCKARQAPHSSTAASAHQSPPCRCPLVQPDIVIIVMLSLLYHHHQRHDFITVIIIIVLYLPPWRDVDVHEYGYHNHHHHHHPEMQKAASMASALVLFFPPAVLIFGRCTRKTC